jgi:hypothetical protein
MMICPHCHRKTDLVIVENLRTQGPVLKGWKLQSASCPKCLTILATFCVPVGVHAME